MNRSIEVKLTSWQRQRLQQIRDNPPTPRIGKRTVCLLLSDERCSGRLISKVTGLSEDAITDIRRRWQQFGMASVREGSDSFEGNYSNRVIKLTTQGGDISGDTCKTKGGMILRR